MPLVLAVNKGPIDHRNTIYSDVLEDLQGNILNGHGRDHALHLFLKFTAPKKEVAEWIANFSGQYVTSAAQQFEGSDRFKAKGEDAGPFGHFALSSAGYQYLGFEPDKQPKASALRNRPATLDSGVEFYDPAVYQKGMKIRGKVLRDPDASTWEQGYSETIHAMVLIATDEPQDLIRIELLIVPEIGKVAEILTGERGFSLRRNFHREGEPEYGVNVEHFGYVDGRSQPLFLKEQVEREKAAGGIDLWNPGAALNLVLVQDPNGIPNLSFGSFLVYRKLEQNVRAFKDAQQKLALETGLPFDLAGAMAVGRFQDGTPIVQQPASGQNPVLNNFDYKADPRAQTCPLHAHLRKSNPRGESIRPGGPFAQSEREEFGHRIARRGVPYGGPLCLSDDLNKLPTNGVGLLFFCYQSDIWEQFEFIQRFWCNNPGFLEPAFSNNPNYLSTGLDALIGQGATPDGDDPVVGKAGAAPEHWPVAWGKPTSKVTTSFSGFVTLKGGEYLFSPSVNFLTRLPDLMPPEPSAPVSGGGGR